MKSINMRELLKAMDELEQTEGIKKDFLLEALKTALEAAYKENYSTEEEVKVDIKKDGEIVVYAIKTVVEEVTDAGKEITLSDAKKIKKSAKIGDFVQVTIVPKNFGRIAIGRGKQIIIQKLREKEKEVRYEEYLAKKGEVISGIVQKSDKRPVILDLGKVEGVILPNERVATEKYAVNEKMKVYVQDVLIREKGDLQIVVSRKTPDFVKRLFEYEIPEIEEGLIEIKNISREAGQRTKLAVYSKNENIDPVGSCVGQKGIRIQSIVDELHGERIDVVEWSEDPAKFIAQALLPARVMAVDVDSENNFATVIVEDDQLSLAIGKAGQNVRLAVELTGFKIDIKTISQFKEILEASEENTEKQLKEVKEIVEIEEVKEVEEVETSEKANEIKDLEIETNIEE